MSQLRRHIDDYLALRRALGFKLEKPGRLLPGFAAFAEAAGAGTVTIDLALRWGVLPQGTSPVWAAQRLSMVRGFARYLQAVDPAVQVPPADLLPARTRRATPYIYSDDDVTALMAAARSLRNPLKAATFETLIGLLAVTGCFSGGAYPDRLTIFRVSAGQRLINMVQSRHRCGGRGASWRVTAGVWWR
jgi:integrase/recombinase XerD